MFILGLTGSIAMGKTTVAGMFRRSGVPVLDADQVVHRLLGQDNTVRAEIKAVFPQAVVSDRIDRAILGKLVFDDAGALARLEGILHPRVRRAQTKFLRLQCRHRRHLVLLDIPLLFETGGERNCDAVAVVSAPAMTQKRRVLARPGMTEERLRVILERQIPDAEKRRRADFVIPTGLGKALSLTHVHIIIDRLWPAFLWPPR